MDNQAMIAMPTMWQRLHWKVLASGGWNEVPSKPLAGYRDATYIELKVHLSFLDKLRVLCGGIIALRTMLNTQNVVGDNKAITEIRIE